MSVAGARRRRRWVWLCLVLAAAGLLAWLAAREATRRDAPLVGVSLDTTVLNQLGLTRVVYDLAVARVGGRTQPLRPGEGGPVEEAVARIDALLLTGGGDVDPALYGREGAPAVLVDRERDDYELALLRAALARDLPVLGICRGLQLLNVAQGGTLRNIRDVPELDAVHGIRVDNLAGHEVTVTPGSKLSEVLGRSGLRVSSFHGQAADRIGEGLEVSAVAPDGVVEALERPDRGFVLAVQWHPELESVGDPTGLALFSELVEAARKARTRRATTAP